MILWRRDFTCNKKLTSENRMAIAKAIATSNTLFYAKLANYIINFVVLAITYMAFGFNILALAIAFVATDIMLTVIDNLVFVYLPRAKTMSASLKSSQKRVAKVIAKRDKLQNTIQDFKDKTCANCTSRYWREGCTDCYEKEYSDLQLMNRFIDQEQKWIDSQLETIKENEIKEDVRQSKDFSSKTEYFINVRNKIAYFIKTYDVTFLNNVLSSIDELNKTLDKKPIGCTLIPGTMYAYLDELQNILSKWVDLDSAQKNMYEKDINRISEAISKFINSLNERIVRLETEDIEVGISVLLNELELNLEEEKKNV